MGFSAALMLATGASSLVLFGVFFDAAHTESTWVEVAPDTESSVMLWRIRAR